MAETITVEPPTLYTDSGSCQGRPRRASSRISSRRLLLSLRRWPRRGQQSSASQCEDTSNLEKTTLQSNSYPLEAVHGRKEQRPSELPLVDEPTAGRDESGPKYINVDKRGSVASTTDDRASSAEQSAEAVAQQECEGPVTFQAYASNPNIRQEGRNSLRRASTAFQHIFPRKRHDPTVKLPDAISSAMQIATGMSGTKGPRPGTRHDEEGNAAQRSAILKLHTIPAIDDTQGQIAPRRERTKIQRVKIWAFGVTRIALPHFKHRDSERDEPTVAASTRQLDLPGSEDEHPQSIQPAKQDAPTAVPPDSQGNLHLQKSAGAKDAEQTVTAPKEDEQLQRDLSAPRITVRRECCETRCEPPHQLPVQPGQKDTRLTLQPDVEDNRRRLVVKDAEHVGRESEEIERLRRDLSKSRSQVAELQKCCEAQSKDREGSNNFFNAADKSSDSDIIRACQRLNAELQQNTTYMVDCLVENLTFQATNSTKERISAMHRVSDRIGQILAESLATPDTRESISMLLQIAFQAYLASALGTAASSWTFEPGYNAFIYEIYQRLRSVEAQAISGCWRTLTRTYVAHVRKEVLVEEILTDLSHILVAAGCTTPQSDIIAKVTSMFQHKVNSLVERAVRLGKMFETMISSDFDVFIARPGEKFEDETMEDTDGDQVGVKEKVVLCATHLGLVKRMPMGTSLWEKGEKRKTTVLKAKILLQSFLDG